MKPCVVLRADASRDIGWGHVKRCLALAAALRQQGAAPLFVVAPSDLDLAALLQPGGFAWVVLDTAHGPPDNHLDALATVRALQGQQPALVLVDHYGLDARWHRAVAQATRARIAAIDDLGDRPLAVDLLIDHNPSHSHADKYRSVLPSNVQRCVGPSFALIDSVYAQTPPAAWCDEVRRIGIFMGGTDPGHHSLLAWRACREVAGWDGPIELATTSANPHCAHWHAVAAQDSHLHLWLDRPHLADFHRSHDLQIGAGGGATWERCALGVPTVALVCAPNQRLSVPWLAAQGVVEAFEAVDPRPGQVQALGALIAGLLDGPAQRAALRARSLALVDGQGARRVAEAMLQLIDKGSSP